MILLFFAPPLSFAAFALNKLSVVLSGRLVFRARVCRAQRLEILHVPLLGASRTDESCPFRPASQEILHCR
jgi:hypothetical protein